jgi:hypothetical protein
MTVYVDADHAHDLVTRRSITGILVMLNSTPIRWVSERQNTLETSTYGSELVASSIAIELTIEFRFILRSLGVDLEGPALMLGDNMSVVLNTSVPSSVLKKKHYTIAYHCVQEAITAKVLVFALAHVVLDSTSWTLEAAYAYLVLFPRFILGIRNFVPTVHVTVLKRY